MQPVLTTPPVSAARSSMYRLLASLFARELTAQDIVNFQTGNRRQLLDALEEVYECAAIIRYLKTYFSDMEDPGQAAMDLAESYAWNFHGVGGPHASPLYASVYVSKNKATHQAIERELASIIHAQGLSAENSAGEPYDHLSVILEFIAWLDEREEVGQERGFTEKFQQKFIGKYLLSWLVAFKDQCVHADRLGFYAGLATRTLAFVEADHQQTG